MEEVYEIINNEPTMESETVKSLIKDEIRKEGNKIENRINKKQKNRIESKYNIIMVHTTTSNEQQVTLKDNHTKNDWDGSAPHGSNNHSNQDTNTHPNHNYHTDTTDNPNYPT